MAQRFVCRKREPSMSTYKNAFEWADAVPGLDHRAASVLNVLARYAYTKDVCWPSVTAIAQATRMDRETVSRHLAILAEGGWITDTGERTGRLRNVTVWRVNWRTAAAAMTGRTLPTAMPEPVSEVPITTPPARIAPPLPPQAAEPITLTWPSLVTDWPTAPQDAPADVGHQMPQEDELPKEEEKEVHFCVPQQPEEQPQAATQATAPAAVPRPLGANKGRTSGTASPPPLDRMAPTGLPKLPPPTPIPVTAREALAHMLARLRAQPHAPTLAAGAGRMH